MIRLLSEGPSDAHAAELEEFGRLAGLWETKIRYVPEDAPERFAEGEWELGYALDGRAVLDVWQIPGRPALAGSPRSPDQECGLCVRIWDQRLRLWRFTFHSTVRPLVIHMYAHRVGEDMVMECADGGDLLRWTFAELRPDSFHWRSERSRNGGGSWRLEQEIHARRVRLPEP